MNESFNSVYFDNVPFKNFDELSLNAIKNIYYDNSNYSSNFGNSLDGNIFINTNIPSDSLKASLEIRTDFPNFSFKNNLHEKNQGAINYIYYLSGTIKLSKTFMPKFVVNLEYKNDNEPYYTSGYKNIAFTENVNNIYLNPLRATTFGTNLNAEFLNDSNFYKSHFFKNDLTFSRNLFAKIVLPISKNTNITIENYSYYKNGNLPVFENTLLNWENNPSTTKKSSSTIINFEQYIYQSEKTKIKLFINFGYSFYNNTLQNEIYKKDFFRYGYSGNYKTYKINSYTITDSTSIYGPGIREQNGFSDTLFVYNSNEYSNDFYVKWNNDFYNSVNHNNVYFLNSDIYHVTGGLLNGQEAPLIYNLWNNPGQPYSLYSEQTNKNIYSSALFNFCYNNIVFVVGAELQKNNYSSYSLKPLQLWELARKLSNKQIQSLDLANPFPVYDNNGIFQDTIWYNRLYNEQLQTYFDYNFRLSKGYAYNSLNWIETDGYKPSDFSMEMFSADEIISENILQMYGYDYTGNKIKNFSYKDYFNYKNLYGVNYRPIKAFEPVCYNVFAKTDFVFKNFNINSGIKLSAYNNKQPVLYNSYSFYRIKKVSEVSSINGNAVSHPANIGSDYAVYVNSLNNPTSIMGYRYGNHWYDFLGNKISNIDYMSQPYVYPYLYNSNISSETFFDDNFKMYKTAYNILPNITVSYPIKNLLPFVSFYRASQNPGDESLFNPINYGYFSNTSISTNYRGIFTNSALLPTTSNNLTIGIYNKPFPKSTIGLVYEHNWTNNIIDIFKYVNGFPNDYYSFVNNPNYMITHNITLSINMQNVLFNKISVGGSICAQEHTKNSWYYNLYYPTLISKGWLLYSIDNRNGNSFLSKVFTKGIELSAFFNFNRYSTFTQNLSSFYKKNTVLRANTNIFKLNISAEKKIPIYNKQYVISLYIIVENLLNKLNNFYYYYETGNLNDDGYLSDPANNSEINLQTNPESFKNYYKMYINNPYYYDIPRTVRFGIKLLF